MTLTYTLIAGGYRIHNAGKPWIDQPFNPSVPGFVPFTPAGAEAAAIALIAEMTAPAEPPALAVE